MKQDIKNKKLRECQAYVPASVEVIDFTAQSIICLSGGTEDSGEGDTTDWWTNYGPINL